MDIIRPRIKDVATLFFSSSSFFEPKYLAVTILNPVPHSVLLYRMWRRNGLPFAWSMRRILGYQFGGFDEIAKLPRRTHQSPPEC